MEKYSMSRAGLVLYTAWYWTISLVLNNLLNGGPQLSYYCPRLYSPKRFLFGGGIIVILSAIVIMCFARELPSRDAQKWMFSIGLFPFVFAVLFSLVLLRVLLSGADSPWCREAEAHRLAVSSYGGPNTARGIALLEAASALAPNIARYKIVLMVRYGKELGNKDKAREYCSEAIRCVAAAIEIKKKNCGVCLIETGVKEGLEKFLAAGCDFGKTQKVPWHL